MMAQRHERSSVSSHPTSGTPTQPKRTSSLFDNNQTHSNPLKGGNDDRDKQCLDTAKERLRREPGSFHEFRIIVCNIKKTTADSHGCRSCILACQGGDHENFRANQNANTAVD